MFDIVAMESKFICSFKREVCHKYLLFGYPVKKSSKTKRNTNNINKAKQMKQEITEENSRIAVSYIVDFDGSLYHSN